jgi:branched-chain amino acid transport system substrate-binding protein
MFMKKIVALLMALTLTLGLAACGRQSAATPSPSTSVAPTTGNSATPTPGNKGGEEILIGCLQDITGPTSSLGKMVEAGAAWSVDEINANGGVDGRNIRMITYDTKGDVNEAINAYTRAVTTDKVSAIIGPPVANIALAIAPISENYDVPVLGFGLDPKCQLKADGTPYKNMFSFQPNAIQQGTTMATYAMKNGFKSFGVVYNEGNAYSVSLKAPFVETVTAAGGTVDVEVPYTANDKDFKTMLSKVIAANVDAIYIPNYTQELILIAQQARALGFEGGLITGLDGCPPFNTLMGEDCDNIYFINNVDDTEPELASLIAAVETKTGVKATNKFFLGYDVAQVLAKIFGEVGTDPAAVQKATENVTNFEGLTGSISIDPATHMPTGLDMVMFTYEGTTPIMLERFSA